MNAFTLFEKHLRKFACAFFSTLCIAVLVGCNTTSSSSEKFAFTEGIPVPDVPAKILREVRPSWNVDPYPSDTVVTVVFIVEADGTVREAAASAADPRWKDIAVRAVKRFLYEPALLDGKPVRSVEDKVWKFPRKSWKLRPGDALGIEGLR